jgi:hypothetical protein
MKPKLRPPGTEHLKLQRNILLSTSAVKFNWRRYNAADGAGWTPLLIAAEGPRGRAA